MIFSEKPVAAFRDHALEVEGDHLLHHEDAGRHPHAGDDERDLAGLRRPQELNVARARQIGHDADRERQAGDDRRRGLGLHAHRLDPAGHLAAVAQHPRQVAEGLGEIAARFLLDRDHDAEEVRLGDRHALEQLRHRVGDRYPKRLRVDDRPELAAQRLLGLAGDHAHAVAERQPGLDAAHDHVDGVRKLLQEGLDAAILKIAEKPARKAEPADEDPAPGDDRVAGDDEQRQGEAEGGDGADDEQFPLRPGQPRLCDPRLDRDLVAGLLTGLKLFEALRHLIAAIDRGDAVDPAFGSALDERLLPLLGARVARQQRIDEDIGEPAGGDRREHGSGDRAVHGMLPLTRARRSCRGVLADAFHGVEGGGEPLLLAIVARPLPEARAPDSSRPVPADELAGGVLADDVVEDEVLRDDDVAFHAHHLGDVGDAARAVAQARRLYDDVDGGADHLADRPRRQREAAHGDHRFKPGQALPRRVRVQRAHGAVVARVHGLEQVEGFGAANLADDDAFGPHAQAVAHEVAHRDLALPFEVRRPGLEPHDMRLLELQLGRVLAGDDALVELDVVREAVQERRLAGAGSAGDHDVAAHLADDLQERRAFGRYRAEPGQLVEGQLVLLELADRQRRPVDRERRSDDVDARAVGQARVADRRRFVDAAADLADDPLADVHQLLIVAEADIGELDLAGDLDVGLVRPVHHHVGDVVARQQRLERAVAEDVVADVVEQLFLLGDRHYDVLKPDDLVDDVADLLAGGIALETRELGEIDRLDQGAEDHALGLVVLLGLALLGRDDEGRRLGRRRLGRGGARRHRLREHRNGRRVRRDRLGRPHGRQALRRSCSWTLAEHSVWILSAAHEALRRANRARIGSSRLAFVRFGSLRPVIAAASSPNASVIFPAGCTSAIIWPLFAAVPKSWASKGSDEKISVPSAFAKSAAEISGRFGKPTWLSTILGLRSFGRAWRRLSKRFLVLRRLASSGAATMAISSAPMSVRRTQAVHRCGTSRMMHGTEARRMSRRPSSAVSTRSVVRSSIAGAARRLRLSLHFDNSRSTRFASSLSGAKIASAMPCGGSWLKSRPAVPKAMSRSATTVESESWRAVAQPRLCATVDEPTPPLAPTTAMVRPTGSAPGAQNRSEIALTTSSTATGAMMYSLMPRRTSSR